MELDVLVAVLSFGMPFVQLVAAISVLLLSALLICMLMLSLLTVVGPFVADFPVPLIVDVQLLLIVIRDRVDKLLLLLFGLQLVVNDPP